MHTVTVVTTPATRGTATGASEIEYACQAPDGSVVVVAAEELGVSPQAPPAGCRLIVLGDPPSDLDVFLILPRETTRGSVLDRALDAACDSLQREQRSRALEERLADARSFQRELLEIGAALSADLDLEDLLERILTAARRLVNADAGSLYLAEEHANGRKLRFMYAQNASCASPWRESLLPIDTTSIAGMVATTGNPLTIADAYDLPEDAPYRFNPSFDLSSGYRTRSLLAVPMIDRQENLVGVLQLINRKPRVHPDQVDGETTSRETLDFTPKDLSLLQAMASQAAVVLQNSRLVDEIQELFESFVRASVTAIEQRDPPTSGHSFRVASYALALSEAVAHHPPPSHTHFRFSEGSARQLRYAALLHDVGKVGVREAVLTKAKRLYPDQERVVVERCEHARRALQSELQDRLLQELLRQDRAPSKADLAWLRSEMNAIDDDIDDCLDVIRAASSPTTTRASALRHLESIARRRFPGRRGEPLPFLSPDELRFLRVSRGSLDEAERREIESHVVHSFNFLSTLPWPRHLADVPRIAGRHHEKLNGRGYPNQLTAGDIPTEVRILTIADIYDALTSGDRPYKASIDRKRAISILENEAEEGALDGELVRVFVEAEVYRHATRVRGPI